MMWFKRKILNYLVQDMLKLVTHEDLLQKRRDGWYVAGERLTPERARKIEETARVFHDSQMWHFLKKDLQYHAFQKGLVKSENGNDQYSAKMMLYLIDQMDKWLRETGTK